MKLVIAIVHDEDANKLVDKLNESHFRVTKLASTGGFLKSGNTTLLTGVEKEKKVDDVLALIREICNTRREVTPSSTLIGKRADICQCHLKLLLAEQLYLSLM